jgi:hypothetical protein
MHTGSGTHQTYQQDTNAREGSSACAVGFFFEQACAVELVAL